MKLTKLLNEKEKAKKKRIIPVFKLERSITIPFLRGIHLNLSVVQHRFNNYGRFQMFVLEAASGGEHQKCGENYWIKGGGIMLPGKIYFLIMQNPVI